MRHIADLVRTQQSTKDKLSSSQDFSILDELLVRALTPLEAETDAYGEWLAEVMTFLISSRRRQNDTLIQACIDGLCGGTNSCHKIMESGIDRELVFSFLGKASKIGQSLERAQLDHIRRRSNRVDNSNLQEIANAKAQLGEGPFVAMAVRTSRYWYEQALLHKEGIIRHYLRLLLKVSSRVNHASGGRVELESAFGDAYIAADMAVNRFRADQGVFASYLSGYLKGSSRVSASNALGLAAPGARVLSADALQADPIDDLDIPDQVGIDFRDESIIRSIDAVSQDADIRAALMVSDVTPPAANALRTSTSKR